jgi:hypothetical protein
VEKNKFTNNIKENIIMDNFDLVSSLHALPESDPIEVNGIQFGGDGGGNNTCQAQCTVLTVNIVQTTCLILSTCC